MDKELKQAIVNFMFDNIDNFQLQNYTTDKFKAYIYDDKGEYLIGGGKVASFIALALTLVRR